MKRILLFLACLAACTPAFGQVVDTTVCAILANPQSFDGKIVRVKGTVVAGFDEFTIKTQGCGRSIWLSYPAGTNAKGGPDAVLSLQLASNSPAEAQPVTRTAVTLDQSKDFKKFDSALAATHFSTGVCLSCARYTVDATLTGRLDGVKEVGIQRNADGKAIAVNGFGNLALYPARLVLQSVSDVKTNDIDYTEADTLTKKDRDNGTGGDDPSTGLNKAAAAFPADSMAGRQMMKAVNAWGKKGEKNGVIVDFVSTSELAKDDGQKGSATSPDGLLLIAHFTHDIMKGNLGGLALDHVGMHIADVRGGNVGNAYSTELHAWQTTVLFAVAKNMKSLTLSGGTVIWTTTWPTVEREGSMNKAISAYLDTWAGI